MVASVRTRRHNSQRLGAAGYRRRSRLREPRSVSGPARRPVAGGDGDRPSGIQVFMELARGLSGTNIVTLGLGAESLAA